MQDVAQKQGGLAGSAWCTALPAAAMPAYLAVWHPLDTLFVGPITQLPTLTFALSPRTAAPVSQAAAGECGPPEAGGGCSCTRACSGAALRVAAPAASHTRPGHQQVRATARLKAIRRLHKHLACIQFWELPW